MINPVTSRIAASVGLKSVGSFSRAYDFRYNTPLLVETTKREASVLTGMALLTIISEMVSKKLPNIKALPYIGVVLANVLSEIVSKKFSKTSDIVKNLK